MGRIVIACYRPKPGKSAGLKNLMKSHLSTLHAEGLVTERKSIVMEAADGTVIEVFEWKSKSAIEKAHSNTAVLAMWGRYEEVAEYIPVAEIPEANELFSEFTPLSVD